ncbi:MAG: GNAT family N-acetyltransferase [Bacteroidia bacterium]|nr:GNAT family N-acetyltransferase [Bacteroidia bacterium]MCZ2247276.1 GNAT family N-acetyltransferase [Bacteroidia bacterium]
MIRFIEGKQIYIRAIELTDVSENYLRWLNEPDVTTGLLSGTFPSTITELQSYVEQKINDRNTVMFAICDKSTNRHIGNIKLDNFDWISHTCELGVLIGEKDFWGKGIGTEACTLAIQYAFNILNIRKVLLAVYATNIGAIKVYEKLGFVNEGTLRKHIWSNGNYIDKHFMGLFKEELKQ